MPLDGERLEREIRDKIDAIFEQESAEQRFIRDPATESKGASQTPELAEFLEELKSFHHHLTEERSTLKALLQLLPHPGDLPEANPEEARREIVELVADIRRVGSNVGPTLDRLLRLTERILQTTSQS